MYQDDISRPDSPQISELTRRESRRSSPEISPIEDSPSPLRFQRSNYGRRGSQIPVPKNPERPDRAEGQFSGWRGKIAGSSPNGKSPTLTSSTRWDDYSGEPTDSETGKPAQVIPGVANFEIEASQRQANNHGQTNDSYRVSPLRYNHIPYRADHIFTPKEPWKGASGRHVIVGPLRDKPLPPGKSPTFPVGLQMLRRNSHEGSLHNQNPNLTSNRPIDRESQQTPNSDMVSSIVPVEPSGNSSRSFSEPPPLPEVCQSKAAPVPDMPPQGIGSHFRQDSGSFANQDNHVPLSLEATRSPPDTVPRHEPTEDNFRARMRYMHLEDQPPSRFSATTCATTAYDSPPATPETRFEHPLPTPPLSILNRKRPVQPSGVSNLMVTSRKPTPADLQKLRGGDGIGKGTSKSLPKSPPEAQAATRVASLEAKRENLERRRINLKTVIHELTNVVQPSSIAYDMASRQEIKKTVAGLNKELSEVMKEEHDTGLQLYRAWKRQEQNSTFEASPLWVKRLAS